MAQIILDSNNNLIQGDFDNATLNNRTKLQTTTTNATTNVYVVPNGSSTSAGVSVANNSSLTNASKIVMATNGTTDTQIISGVNGSGSYLPLSFYTNNALAMQIDTANNVLVGTTTSAFSSAGRGVIELNGSSTAYYALKASDVVKGSFNFAAAAINVQANSIPITFGTTGGSEWMRIDSSGYVQIGANAKFTDEQLYVNQAADATSIIARVGGASSSSSPALKTVKFTNVNNSSQIHLTFSYNNGANGNGAIVGNGDSQAAFATFSDSRLKKNITDLPSQLNKINALRPVEFDYIKSGDHQIGFIAQEVKEVYPDLVAESEDGMLTVVGLGKTEARLIKAIQEQQTIINELKTRIEALESK